MEEVFEMGEVGRCSWWFVPPMGIRAMLFAVFG